MYHKSNTQIKEGLSEVVGGVISGVCTIIGGACKVGGGLYTAARTGVEAAKANAYAHQVEVIPPYVQGQPVNLTPAPLYQQPQMVNVTPQLDVKETLKAQYLDACLKEGPLSKKARRLKSAIGVL